MFEVNLFGQIAVIHALMPALIRSKGRIVNISSVGGKVAMATYGPYAGTKFALEAVSDALRRELAPSSVRVVVVEPGAVRTAMLGRAIDTARDVVAGMTPSRASATAVCCARSTPKPSRPPRRAYPQRPQPRWSPRQ